ncbi:PD-(D/E)XK nuclease family protein [Candidatus Woesearchaeota archaeon]|nr:PD-(D/E)XK nuclease family protein [Candidatus Woesearchaeota archaeon]
MQKEVLITTINERPALKAARVQSPSSINTFKQCARKYYYQYIEKLETLPSIHLIRGKIMHAVLEDFFKFNINHISAASYEFELRIIIFDLFKKHWINGLREMRELSLTQSELLFYHNESKIMLQNWYERFIKELKIELQLGFDLINAFNKLTPRCEEEYSSPVWSVRGFVDAIHEFEEEIHILDYKTSKKNEITPEYRLQLAIYALLYFETHGKMPTKVGIDFLKFDKQFITVDERLLELARKEIEFMHENTQSVEMKDYPKHITALCKWHSGQCDFYDTCVKSD